MDKKNIKNNLEYFWMYYKWQVIAVFIVVILTVYFGVSVLKKKDNALSVMLIDCHTEVSQEQMEEDFMKYSGLDDKVYEVQIQNNLMFADSDSGSYTMTSLSRFLADIGSEKLDVCGMLEEDFMKYDNSNTFMDLRDCFTEEELLALEEKLIETEDGRIIGIYADSLPEIERYGCYEDQETNAGLGIIYNTQHKETAVQYLRFLAGIV